MAPQEPPLDPPLHIEQEGEGEGARSAYVLN